MDAADSTVRPELLARHVYHLLRRALEGIPEDDGAQPANQVALANRLVEVLVEYGAMADDRVADAARLLLEAVETPGIERDTIGGPRARHSPFGRPACSSMDGATSRSQARLRERSRAPIGSISCVHSCGTQGCGCSVPSLQKGFERAHACA